MLKNISIQKSRGNAKQRFPGSLNQLFTVFFADALELFNKILDELDVIFNEIKNLANNFSCLIHYQFHLQLLMVTSILIYL